MGNLEKKNIQGRDLLTLLIKANMATDIPDSARMSDEDVLSRESSRCACYQLIRVDENFDSKEVPTFLIAGHETTR
jgi:hypothetical protein